MGQIKEDAPRFRWEQRATLDVVQSNVFIDIVSLTEQDDDILFLSLNISDARGYTDSNITHLKGKFPPPVFTTLWDGNNAL